MEMSGIAAMQRCRGSGTSRSRGPAWWRSRIFLILPHSLSLHNFVDYPAIRVLPLPHPRAVDGRVSFSIKKAQRGVCWAKGLVPLIRVPQEGQLTV